MRRCRSSTTQWNTVRWIDSTMPMSSSATCSPCRASVPRFQRPRCGAAEPVPPDRPAAVAVGPLPRRQHVGAVARAADGDEQVARRRQVLELFDEDAVEALVVAPGQDVRGVVGQAEDAQPPLAVVVEVLAPQRALAEFLAEGG